jgi:hypothetical protein
VPRSNAPAAAPRIMVKKYPGNDFAADVDRHLLNHPPNPQ